MGKWCLHASSFIFDRIIIKVAGNHYRHKSSDEFDFGPLVSMAHLCVFLNEIWPWHIGLRWAIVALWATCFAYSVSFVSQYIPQQFCFSSPESKAHWWVYRIGRSLSSVVPPSSVRRPHSLNISSETTGPSKWNFIWSFSGMEERKFVQTVTK